MFDLNSTILIIDDMRTMRKVVQKSCQDLGFKNFLEAEDGSKAWEILQEKSVQLVISDWNMPVMTGLDLLKKVRATDKTKALPFLLLTAESEADQVKAALLAGVDNYLVKPFATKSLGEKIQAVYNKRFPKAG